MSQPKFKKYDLVFRICHGPGWQSTERCLILSNEGNFYNMAKSNNKIVRLNIDYVDTNYEINRNYVLPPDLGYWIKNQQIIYWFIPKFDKFVILQCMLKNNLPFFKLVLNKNTDVTSDMWWHNIKYLEMFEVFGGSEEELKAQLL